ncbi:hypothetical protein AXK30_00060 [Escherichia coli]|nr:hypothetical protein AXK30_00060 [Escherichia coli]
MYLHLEDALVEKAKQVTWRLLAAGVCLLTVSSVARATHWMSSVAVTRKSSRPGIIDRWMWSNK